MTLFLRINKVDVPQRLVYGTLSEEVRDKSDEILDYATAKPAFEKWSNEIKEASGGKSLGNVRAMHSAIAAGKFTDIKYDDDAKRIEGCAKIIDDNEWNKVVEGVYTGFSIGGGYARRWPDPDNSGVMRYTPTLAEVSIVDNPCVPTATFEYIKADGSVEMRKFITPSHKEDSMDPKAIADAREALAKGTATDEQKALIAKVDAELLKAAQDAIAAGTATDEQKALVKTAADCVSVKLVEDGKRVLPQTEPESRWLSKRALEILEAAGALEEACVKKDDARVRNLILEKQTELAPGLAQMDALLKAAKKPAEDEDEDAEGDDDETKKAKKARRDEKAAKAKEKAEKDDAEMAAKAAAAELAKQEKEAADKAAADALGKKDYSDKERKEMAGKEAMDDGSFPIKTKKDVKDAVDDWGRAGSKPEVKAHIIARAKAIGAEDALPDDWKAGKKKDKKEKSAPKGALEKGLHQVGWLAHMLNELSCFQDSVEMEQYFEGDKDSELPAKLKSLVSEMCGLLVTLVEEETKELVEDNEDTDVEVLEMAAGLPAGHPEAISKATRAKAEPLVKSDSKKESEFGAQLIKFSETLEKAGARHSKADAERVQALHDHAAEVVKCFGEMAEKCSDMHKSAGEAKNTALDLGAKGERYDDDAEKIFGGDAAKMSKSIADLAVALTMEKSEKAAFATIIGRTNEMLEKAGERIGDLNQQNSELVKRVETLEAQPMPGKVNLRTFSKTQDSGGANGETEAEYQARLEKMTQDQRTIEMIKVARRSSVAV